MPHLDLTLATADDLSVRRFSVEEALSSLFDVHVWARSPDPSLDLSAIVGHDASLRVTSGYAHARGGGARLWSGIVAHAALVQAEPTGLSTYSFRIVPRLWLLTQRRGYRIFQHLNIPDILDKLLAEWTLPHDWNIRRSAYPALEFKVQYGESDFDFFCRLLEEAGITFHFPDDDSRGSILTLNDEPQSSPPRAPPPLPFVDSPSTSAEMEYVTHLRLAHTVRPGALTIRDHDFRNPSFPLFGEAEKAPAPENRYEQYHYKPGGFLTDGHKPEKTPSADDRGVARRDQEFGDDRADRALVGLRVGREAVAFETNTVDLWPGAVFHVSGHPHPGLGEDRGLLVTRFLLEGTHDDAWVMSGEAVFADAPYRPELRTPKPKAHGVQSAVVVGPPGQEIHTDEFGRVRVQLPWDREGHLDEKSTCWMRVNQGWGGQGYGFLVLPRIGQEVIVTFEHGDPDQPMIVGRAFNATNPVPYKLPDNKTISTWKSNSSKGGGGFNEIKLEDKKGDELVYVQAEKNLRKLVKHDETITVLRHREKHVLINETDTTLVNRFEVTGVNRTESTGANRTTHIGGTRKKLVKKDETVRTEGGRKSLTGKNVDVVVHGEKKDLVEDDACLTVRGHRHEKIDGDQHLSILEDQLEKVTGSHALETGKELHLRSAELFVGEGARDVTLKGPGGFIRIDPSGVTIKGIVVKINTGGSSGKGKGSKPKLPREPKEAKVETPALPAAGGAAGALSAGADSAQAKSAAPAQAHSGESAAPAGGDKAPTKTDTCEIEKVEYACEHDGKRKFKLFLPADKSQKPPVNVLEVVGGPKGHGDNIKTVITMKKPRCGAHKSQALTVRGAGTTITKAEETSTIEAAYDSILTNGRFFELLWPWNMRPVDYTFSPGACATNHTQATIRVYPAIEQELKLVLALDQKGMDDRVEARIEAAQEKGYVERRGRPAHTGWKIELKGKVKYGPHVTEAGIEHKSKVEEWASFNRLVKRAVDTFCEYFFKFTGVEIRPLFPNLSLEYKGKFKEIDGEYRVGTEWSLLFKADPFLGLTAKFEIFELLINNLAKTPLVALATALGKIRAFAKKHDQKLELYLLFTGKISGEVGATKKVDLAKVSPSGGITGKVTAKFAAEAAFGGSKWGASFKVGAEISAETGIAAKLTVDSDKKGLFFKGKLSIAECKFEYAFYATGKFFFEVKESYEGEHKLWDELDLLKTGDHYILRSA
jgi:type VI secretion system secreted protein VgrG